MTVLIILFSFILAGVSITAVLAFLTYNRLSQLIIMNGAYKADDLAKRVETPKHKLPSLKPQKQELRGRNVVASDDFVDISDLPWEEGIKAIEDMGNG